MSIPRTPLSNFVPWSRLASELEIHVRTMGLPAATTCPFCKGVMRVYRDPLLGGEWFHCPSCQRQGDMIELAAAVWKLEVPATVSRLKRLGFSVSDSADDVAAYQRHHVEYRGRLQQLWNEALARLDESRMLIRLCHHLGMMCDPPEELRAGGPAAILRGTNAVTVERCFAPGAMKHADARPQRNNPSEGAIFRGGAWDEVLMVPFYDLPWRICAFAFMGRRADLMQDIVFKRANLGPPRALSYEAGLAMHPRALEVSERWDDTIIAMGDLITAWRLQMRHVECHLWPLPVVAWHDSHNHPTWHAGTYLVRTREAWDLLGGRKIVFWMPVATVATFQQAIHTSGKISTVGPREPDEDSVREYCWKFTPEDLCKHIQEHARPWPEVLSRHLDALTGPALEDFLAKLEIGGVDLDEVTTQLAHGTRLRLARVRSSAFNYRCLDYEGHTTIEKNNVWYMEGRKGVDELITNAVLRIDARVWNPNDEEIYYAGRVCYEDKVVEFCETKETIERDCFDWLDKLLMRRILECLIGNPGWSRRLVPIAMKFQKPVIIRGVDRVGYDCDSRRFVFPKFTIEEGGKVSTLKYSIFPDPVPAKDLDPPEALSPEELNRPAQRCGQGGAEVFWGVMACVLANVLAPAFHCRPHGIVLLGHVASVVGEALAKVLGCVQYWPRTKGQASKALRGEQQHGWPVVLEVIPDLQRRYRRLLFDTSDQQSRNCIVTTDLVDARLLAVHGGWHTITTDQEGGIAADTLVVAKMLVPAYLTELSERRFDLGKRPTTSANLVTLVLQDLARFVKARHGDEDDVLSAGRAITVDDEQSRAEALADLLGYFLDTGKLQIGLAERRKPALLEVEHDGQKGLLLPYASLEKLTARSSAPPPSTDRLHEVLEKADVLLGEDYEGPVYQREWFDERRRMSRAKSSGLMKVCG